MFATIYIERSDISDNQTNYRNRYLELTAKEYLTFEEVEELVSSGEVVLGQLADESNAEVMSRLRIKSLKLYFLVFIFTIYFYLSSFLFKLVEKKVRILASFCIFLAFVFQVSMIVSLLFSIVFFFSKEIRFGGEEKNKN